MSYQSNLNLVKAGEPVLAGVVNRPIEQLSSRTQQLKNAIELAEAGQALILRDETLDPSTVVGTPVYWDEELQRFSPAQAVVDVDEATGEYVRTLRADPIGLVYAKHSAYSGDIVMFGVVDLPGIRDILGEGSGRFFLGADTGTLTFDELTVSIPMGQVLGHTSACSTDYKVYVNPEYARRLFDHVTYSHDLTAKLVDTDTLKGWLPVTAEDTDAPAGATYKYNLVVDTDLAKLWPPIPLGAVACTIDWNTGGESTGGKDIPVNKLDSLVQVDMSNIWWMASDVVPFTNTTSTTYRKFRVTLHFSKIRFSNRKVYVTSLRPYEDHPVAFVDCDGRPATSGDLFAKLTIAEQFVDAEVYEGVAMRKFTEDYKQEIVPVINGLTAGDSSIVLSSDKSVVVGDTTYTTGLTTISVDTFREDYELQPQIVKLYETVESDYDGLTYIGMPYNRETSFSAKYEIPSNYVTDNIAVKLRVMFLAVRSGTHPAITLEYFRVPRPAGGANVSVNTEYTAIPFDTGVTTLTGTCFEVESGEFMVSRGDTIIVRFSRSTGSSYPAEAAVVRFNAIINRSE